MAREDHKQLGINVKGVARPFPAAPSGKHKSWHNMHTDARNAVQTFEADQAGIDADVKLSDTGKELAKGEKVQEFDAMHRTWTATADKRLEELNDQLRDLRGRSARDSDDAAGELRDQWRIEQYRALRGDELANFNGALKRGEHPEIAASLLRGDDVFSGLRPDIRQDLEAINFDPEDRDQAVMIQEEQADIVAAREAWKEAEMHVLGQAGAEGVAIQTRDALAAEGLQKVEGENRVEPFEDPGVEPFEPGDDGIIDFKVTRNEDAA